MPFAKFQILGTMGADVDVQFSGGGNPYARFSVCVNRWDSQEKKEKPSWFWCVLFGKVAERFAEQAQKGSTVALLGEMEEDGGEHKGRHSFIVREFDVVRNWRERDGQHSDEQSRRGDAYDDDGYDRRDDPRSRDNRREDNRRGGRREARGDDRGRSR